MTKLLTQQDVAEYLGVSTRTVRDLPIRRVRPTQRTVRYRVEDVEAYLAKRTSQRKGAA